MGPIPLPIKLPGVDTTVQWYAAVRSTELRGVEALASELNARGGQHLFAHLVSPLAVNSVLVVGEPATIPWLGCIAIALPAMCLVLSAATAALS